jgi:DDE superfamily endonuclease
MPPFIAPSLVPLVALFEGCFTLPSFDTFQHILGGWILCLGRHTVTGVLRASGAIGHKHHTSFHRFFRSAAWHLDSVALCLVRLVMTLAPTEQAVIVPVDDTLGRHTGKHIRAASMHHDPLLSTRTKAVFHWGHVWVVLAVVIRVPAWKKSFALPVLARLYRSKKLCAKEGRPFRKKTELAAELICILAGATPERQFVVVADSAYGNASILKRLPANVHFTGRSRLDAAIYASPKQRRMGRPRVKGRRLPSPGQRAASGTGWRRLTVEVYGATTTVQVKEFDALWYIVAGGRRLHFVLVRGWPGHDKDDVLFTTDLTLNAETILVDYCLRWSLEVTFHEAKGKLGFEDPQNRTERAVERTAPMALWAYSLTVVWYLTVGKGLPGARPLAAPWYRKQVPAFSDMLAALRRETWRRRLFDPARIGRGHQKSFEPLLHAVGYGG